jgi:uncharacterized membrane protein
LGIFQIIWAPRVLATIGLALTALGALLVFLSSPTITVPVARYGSEGLSEAGIAQIERSHRIRGRIGFILIFVGSIFQAVALWIPQQEPPSPGT